MGSRIATIQHQIAECAREDRRMLVGYVAGLRLNGEWRDADVQGLIRGLDDARRLVAEAKAWLAE